MRKKSLLILSLILIFSVWLAACTPAEQPTESGPAETADTGDPEPTEGLDSEEQVTLNVMSFTNEIMTMAIAFEERYPNVDVQFTMLPMTDGEYQTKLKASIGTADVPDVVALEAAFVKEWVEADFLADLNDLLPVAEEPQTYPSVVEVVVKKLDVPAG
jgi:ABC-type glycerol-3-phosphate transport system substrate-binding protein